LTEDGYFKYKLSKNSQHNKIIAKGTLYYPAFIYLVNGYCIVEAVAVAAAEPFFFMVPLTSSWFVSRTALDPLFSGTENRVVIDLQNTIANNQPCLLTTNCAQLTLAVSVPFVFPDNMKTYDKIAELAGLSLQYPLEAVATSAAAPPPPPTVEGMCDASGNQTFVASNDAGEAIAEIAMVPITSDALTGLYEISLLRMVYDFFLFICALFFCYFFVVEIYIAIFIKNINSFVKKIGDDDDKKLNDKKNNVMWVFDMVSMLGALLLGIGLAADGASVPSVIETALGIFIIIASVVSWGFIKARKMQITEQYPFLKTEVTIADHLKLAKVNFHYFLYAILLFLGSYFLCLIIVLVYDSYIKINVSVILTAVSWGACLLFAVLMGLIINMFRY
jgi:hypothetical protein